MSLRPAEESAEVVNVPRVETQIIANFSEYTPPFNVVRVASRLLATVPPKYLVGLSSVVLTNKQALSRPRRRTVIKPRRRRGKQGYVCGLYHNAWQGKPAWIEIFVDETLDFGRRDDSIIKLPLTGTFLIGSVLFHEIGHHIHATVRPEYRDKEVVAESWVPRLFKNYFRTRYSKPRRMLIKQYWKLLVFLARH